MADRSRVVVVGAGIGGLVSALLAAGRGLDVTLVEAGDRPGGKMRAVEVDGVSIDAGPTVFTMRWVFEQILDAVGTSLDALVTTRPLDVLARHAWRGDPATLDLHADAAAATDAIARFASPAEARRFAAFREQARRVYATLEGPHIRSGRPTLARMATDLGPAGLATLSGLGPFASLWRALGRHFHDPRLRQLFGRYATYCGTSPWQAPATLMLVAHVEMQGVWSIDGGMAALATQLATLAGSRGVRLRWGTPVARIVVERGQTAAVELAGGERLPADAVIFNGDADALAQGLLGPAVRDATRRAPLRPAARSLSALTLAMHVRTDGFALDRHNVFFDADYAGEFDDVFRGRRLPRRGTVYVCAQDRGAGAAAVPPGARERLLALVNAPADGDRAPLDASEIDSCEQRSLTLLRDCGLRLDIASPAQVLRRTPADFHRLFPGSGGALYGPAGHGWMSVFRRSGAATAIPGLFLAGGSVHPGPGVPMAAMSGRLAVATLMEHLGSTRRSHPVRISGGMSTRSATTGATR
ncbi:MAG: phytoene desaturase family protein [Burkholderiales bacterium]|nr:phytoene desaturase family protein [Burkholderiales bacterium]